MFAHSNSLRVNIIFQHNFHVGWVKSFVDDLNKDQSTVSMRVAFVLRSTEVQLLVRRFVWVANTIRAIVERKRLAFHLPPSNVYGLTWLACVVLSPLSARNTATCTSRCCCCRCARLGVTAAAATTRASSGVVRAATAPPCEVAVLVYCVYIPPGRVIQSNDIYLSRVGVYWGCMVVYGYERLIFR